ncbi:unnamed protein product [Euphydryas editha]|uniref:Uncharacterized protein n=1 Tax=Euphydryas editha TaxID=104508 RepID=A0AAU9UWR6_EUPED|nr:unnamed protein product [Euphydryas editha]
MQHGAFEMRQAVMFVSDANPITPNQQRRRPNWALLMRGRAFLTACANKPSVAAAPNKALRNQDDAS